MIDLVAASARPPCRRRRAPHLRSAPAERAEERRTPAGAADASFPPPLPKAPARRAPDRGHLHGPPFGPARARQPRCNRYAASPRVRPWPRVLVLPAASYNHRCVVPVERRAITRSEHPVAVATWPRGGRRPPRTKAAAIAGRAERPVRFAGVGQPQGNCCRGIPQPASRGRPRCNRWMFASTLNTH